MSQPPSSAASAGRVTLIMHGPLDELATALRTIAAALDHEHAASSVRYTISVATEAPAPGGLTAAQADLFVAQLTPAAVDALVLCRNAPELSLDPPFADRAE